jgi:hypothetical protein
MSKTAVIATRMDYYDSLSINTYFLNYFSFIVPLMASIYIIIVIFFNIIVCSELLSVIFSCFKEVC